MFMENLRSAKNKWKVPMTILIVLIIVGLLGSYALMGSQLGLDEQSGSQKGKVNQLKADVKTSEKALKADPKNKELLVAAIDARYSLGEMEFALGRGDEGSADLAKSLDHMIVLDGVYGNNAPVKDRVDLYNRMGVCYYIAGDKDNYTATYKKAIKLDPANTDILNSYVGLMIQDKDFDVALKYLADYRKALPTSNKEAISTVDGLISSVKAAQNTPATPAE